MKYKYCVMVLVGILTLTGCNDVSNELAENTEISIETENTAVNTTSNEEAEEPIVTMDSSMKEETCTISAKAIDINPIQNPYVSDGNVSPEAGSGFTDRKQLQDGMIVEGDNSYNAFVSRGWTWGGSWNTMKDYQHFQKNIDVDSL